LFVFLAGAGTGAGQRFLTILQQTGPKLLLAGALITLVATATAIVLIHVLWRWNLLYGAGALCACMTNPPGLAAASELADVDAAAVGFASVYPVALIAKIILAPLVFLILQFDDGPYDAVAAVRARLCFDGRSPRTPTDRRADTSHRDHTARYLDRLRLMKSSRDVRQPQRATVRLQPLRRI